MIDPYVKLIGENKYLGIKVSHWIEFFKSISETSTDEEIEKRILSLKKSIQESNERSEKREIFLAILQLIEDLWKDVSNG